MWILNLGKPVNIPVLSEQMAIELGANLLGEFVIFAIGSALIVIEYTRQSYKEAAKEAKKEEEAKHLRNTITELYFSVQQQQTQIKELERMIYTLDGKKPPDSSPTPPEKPVNNRSFPENKSNTDIEIKTISYSIPYPDNGIILKSLNYIQMDVLSSSIFSKEENGKVINEPISNSNVNKVELTITKRESAVLSEALHNIENNFRSLF
ncbi:Putative OPA3-like protein CG13603 [Eumeta japonica]|uniref:OPA3-like protein CG13603 n=1 Tax=Eumeta variegata TaxID=151549 RepID=A0A4C1UD13_EUMVA|nr:Putative OPA3-like protein CG13603 [Eumeta japonica]